MISRLYFRTLIVGNLFLNICCGTNAEQVKKIIDTNDLKIKKNSILSDTNLAEVMDTTYPKVIDLMTAKNIEILSFAKKILKGDTTDKYYKKCESWSLTSDQLKIVIRKFKPISSEVENLVYSYMACEMTGKIKIDNTEFKYWINAGSTLTLINKDTTLYFGCSSKECKRFFLTGKDLPESFH